MSEDNHVEVKKPVLRLFEGELKRAEYERTDYCLVGKVGFEPEDYAKPESYAHVSTLRSGDLIHVLAEDKIWYAEVLVLDVTGNRVSVALLRKFRFERDVESAHEDYDVKFAGAAKWRVMRKSDNHASLDVAHNSLHQVEHLIDTGVSPDRQTRTPNSINATVRANT